MALVSQDFSNFGSLKSTETRLREGSPAAAVDFSNFGSLKSTETVYLTETGTVRIHFSNFGSLKSTETGTSTVFYRAVDKFQQFRLVEEH